jgi:phospholipase C
MTCPVPLVPAGVTGPPADSPANSPVGKIKHIVIIVQENRTFDNLFHGFSEPSGAKADAATYGCDIHGVAHTLASVPFESQYGASNGHTAEVADYDGGKNDGFYTENASTSTNVTDNGNNSLAYLPQTEVQPYFDMATNGALAERYFDSVTAPTYPSHMMYLAASSTWDDNPGHRVIDNPPDGFGCQDTTTTDTVAVLDTDNPNAPGVFPCFHGVTNLTDTLDAAGHTWHYYSFPVTVPGEITPGATEEADSGLDLNAVPSYYQSYERADFTTNDVTPSEQVLTDVATGTLEDVTWVTPDNADSDHPAQSTAAGPAWVESVVDAIGESSFYSSTAIFVTWDDFGGWYDHVPPPQKYPPYGLSMRTGLILISPYARHGQLIDTQFEPGSLVRFIEETFGLPSLGREDATANSLDDMFDFAQTPAAFVPIVSAVKRFPPTYFLHQKPSGKPLDDDMLGPYHLPRIFPTDTTDS